MKRCNAGKRSHIKFRNAGEAARYVSPGLSMGLYKCKECGYYHLTRSSRIKGGKVAW